MHLSTSRDLICSFVRVGIGMMRSFIFLLSHLLTVKAWNVPVAGLIPGEGKAAEILALQ